MSAIRTANITKKSPVLTQPLSSLVARVSTEQTLRVSEHGSKMHPRIVTIREEEKEKEEETKTRVPTEWD